jgi:carbonic anhydrase
MKSFYDEKNTHSVVRTTVKLQQAVVIFSALAVVACQPAAQHEAAAVDDVSFEAAAHDMHWGYTGEGAPEHWADLDPGFALCGEGVEQSPVDLTGAVPIENTGFERLLGETVLNVTQRARVMDLVDNGHTIQITNDVPMSTELGGVRCELVQYHFHAPSEHTIDGEHAPLEVHFVHKTAAGKLAVIGILVEEGTRDVLWDPIIEALPAAPGDTRHVEDLDLDMSELRPLPTRYYRYAGSLTTPPCCEGVQWVVMAEKRQISIEQMAALVSHLHDNNPPVQPLGNRRIGKVPD